VRARLPASAFAALLAIGLAAAPALAQTADAQPPPTPAHDHHVTPPDNGEWTWAADANAFFGYNYQERRFADFWAWESQNWMMLSADRAVGAGRLTLQGMLSLEPWTIGRLVYAHGLNGPERLYAYDNAGQQQPIGASPQAFQTGESYLGSPLINYQHPHDLLMGLGATYRFGEGRARYTVGADLVGAPALGPTPFMHRASARNNPSAPLTHHYMDATHITPGVVRAGVEVSGVGVEASVFRGEEPDDDRLNIETPRLNSWSMRGSGRRGPWSAQFSVGRLHQPEWFEPVDVTRLTASVAFDGTIGRRPLAATAAWGQNRELTFALDGYLVEWDFGLTDTDTIYGRGESVLKEIFGLGVHPAGLLNHPRNFSQINALTIGYVRALPIPGLSGVGVGADITMHDTSQDLVEYYGSPTSYHVFVRWRPLASGATHIH
jgi:hypothetical protein